MEKLVFKMREALEKFKELWSTLDKDKINKIVRFCLARELTGVEERKDAAEYALKRPKSFDFFDDNIDFSAVKSTSFAASSPSRAGSPSPKKTNRFDTAMKTTVRDANTTNFELKSIGESDGRGMMPRAMTTFKDPPSLKMSMLKTATETKKNAPTAENLRKLSTTRVSLAGDGGAKSARSRLS